MVLIAEEFRFHRERDRERREIAELKELARWLLVIFAPRRGTMVRISITGIG